MDEQTDRVIPWTKTWQQKEIMIHTVMWMNPKKPGTKEYLLHDSIYTEVQKKHKLLFSDRK